MDFFTDPIQAPILVWLASIALVWVGIKCYYTLYPDEKPEHQESEKRRGFLTPIQTYWLIEGCYGITLNVNSKESVYLDLDPDKVYNLLHQIPTMAIPGFLEVELLPEKDSEVLTEEEEYPDIGIKNVHHVQLTHNAQYRYTLEFRDDDEYDDDEYDDEYTDDDDEYGPEYDPKYDDEYPEYLEDDDLVTTIGSTEDIASHSSATAEDAIVLYAYDDTNRAWRAAKAAVRAQNMTYWDLIDTIVPDFNSEKQDEYLLSTRSNSLSFAVHRWFELIPEDVEYMYLSKATMISVDVVHRPSNLTTTVQVPATAHIPYLLTQIQTRNLAYFEDKVVKLAGEVVAMTLETIAARNTPLLVDGKVQSVEIFSYAGVKKEPPIEKVVTVSPTTLPEESTPREIKCSFKAGKSHCITWSTVPVPEGTTYSGFIKEHFPKEIKDMRVYLDEDLEDEVQLCNSAIADSVKTLWLRT